MVETGRVSAYYQPLSACCRAACALRGASPATYVCLECLDPTRLWWCGPGGPHMPVTTYTRPWWALCRKRYVVLCWDCDLEIRDPVGRPAWLAWLRAEARDVCRAVCLLGTWPAWYR
jgi:hypothetical protein